MMASLEVLLAKAEEKSEISKRLLAECQRVRQLRDSCPQGSEKRKEYRLILDGLLMATNIVVSK